MESGDGADAADDRTDYGLILMLTSSSKTILIATLAPGSTPEARVPNDQFLDSFLEYGCWFRSVAAYAHFQTLTEVKSKPIQRLAALTAFYQLAGQAIEDSLTNLIAWSVWADDKNASLPDILERLSLRFNVPDKEVGENYCSDVKAKFRNSSKRVDVFPRDYLRMALDSERDIELPNFFGIEWKKHPSVKVAPPKVRSFWDQLPFYIREFITPLTEDRGAMLAACYNKVKHGPQLVVSSPAEGALARGQPINVVQKEVLNELSVRLLMDGGRTQETAEEVTKSIRVAPFLIDDRKNIKQWYYQQLVHNASGLFMLGTFVFNTTFRDKKRKFTAPNDFLEAIVAEQQVHVRQTFPLDSFHRGQ
jgi:hypothetical protein